MRTTVDLPPELMRAAKIAATERGMSLKDLFTRALAHEIGEMTQTRRKKVRLRLPLIGTADSGPKVDITNDDIATAFEAEDIARYLQ